MVKSSKQLSAEKEITDNLKAFKSCIYRVWDELRYDSDSSCSNEAILECIEADRIQIFTGNKEVNDKVNRLVDKYGADILVEILAKRIKLGDFHG